MGHARLRLRKAGCKEAVRKGTGKQKGARGGGPWSEGCVERVAQAAGDEERGGMRGSCRQGWVVDANRSKKIATWEICIRPSTGPAALNQNSGEITGV